MYKSESDLQARCYQWFHNNYSQYRGCLFAVPNGGKRDKREAMALKATGVVSGVSDMIFYFFGDTHFIEMKMPNGKQSENQKKFMDNVTMHYGKGHYHIIRSEVEFQELIKSIIKI